MRHRYEKTKVGRQQMCGDLSLSHVTNIRWISCLSLKPPRPAYELSLSGGCLFLSAAPATAVHDITEIFITPASKSRQADDKHACGWVSFL